MTRLSLSVLAALLISACTTPMHHDAPSAPLPAPSEAPATHVASPTPPPMPSNLNSLSNGGDPRVQVFSLDGPVVNPLALDQTRSTVDNTTKGGFTVFDDSVTVYPVDGVDTQPNYLPDYSVPPLADASAPRVKPTVGKPVAEVSLTPDPLDTALEENPRAVKREPLQGPLTPLPKELAPVAKAQAAVKATPAPSSTELRAAGARSMPMLTGY